MCQELESESRGRAFTQRWLGDWGGRLLAGFCLIAAAYAVFLLFPFTSAEHTSLFSSLVSVIVFAGPALLAWRASRHPAISARSRLAWSFISLANLSFSLGSSVWIYYENILGEQPFPSLADVGYLVFYPLMLAGLLLLVEKMKSAEERLNFTLDASIIMIGGGIVLWYFLLDPIAAAGDGDALKTALSLAYPIGDLVLLLGISSLLLRRAEFASHGVVNFMLAGLTINFVYDFLFAYQNLTGTYATGSPVDIIFCLPSIPLLIAAHLFYVRASEQPADGGARAPGPPRFFWVPYLAIAAVLFVLLKVAASGGDPKMFELLIVSSVVAALVILRQFMFIRENTNANTALTEMQQRIQGIYSASTDAIGLASFSGTITEVNDSFVRLTGRSRHEIVGAMSYLDFVPEDYLERSLTPEIAIEDRRPIEYERELVRKDGTTRNVTTTLFAVNDRAGVPAAMAIVIRDITDRRQLERQLTHQALHDPLTGLANRVLLSERVSAALSRARRLRSEIAVMFLDLDNFKTVNDTLGHAAGDSLLVTVADRLRSCLRSSDTPARLGGDEFAILIEDIVSPQEELAVAERILTAIRTAVEINGKQAFVGASIGIARSSASVVKPEDLLRNADVAMYTAKNAGKNRCSVYEDAMHAAVLRRAELEAELRSAIERDEFELFYQPIVELSTGAIVAMESLIRWNHPNGTQIGPADFIPIAEEANLIGRIGSWVLNESCRQAARWQKMYSREDPFALTVNISGHQFVDGGFVELVAAVLARAGMRPDRLVLEITESTMLVNTESTIEKLKQIRGLGVRLAIDDFGTGYSSLSYLNRFPVDVLKIDQSFVQNVGESAHGAAMAGAIVSMSETLQLTTIAEGIETHEQADRLKQIGCAWGQGYVFSKPLSAPDMDKFLKDAYGQNSITMSAHEDRQDLGIRPLLTPATT